MGSIAAKQHRPRMRIRTRQDIVGTNNKNRDEDAASRTRNAEARSHTHQRRNVDKTRARRGFANLCGHPRPWPQQCRLKVWSALPSVGLIICGKVNTHKLSWSLLTKPSSLGATIRGGGRDGKRCSVVLRPETEANTSPSCQDTQLAPHSERMCSVRPQRGAQSNTTHKCLPLP